MYQPPWEIDPLEYLVRRKFPLVSSMAVTSSPHASANTHERARVAETQAAGYREELKALAPNEISRLAKEAALAGEEEVRIRRELEENQRFFNQSRADVDVTHWSRMSYWTLDEAVALSLGKDPRVVKWDRVKSLVHSSPFATEFDARREIVIRAIVMRQISNSTIPAVFLAWADRMQFPMPANTRRCGQGARTPNSGQEISLQRTKGDIAIVQVSHTLGTTLDFVGFGLLHRH
jgi:hypothetical protein